MSALVTPTLALGVLWFYGNTHGVKPEPFDVAIFAAIWHAQANHDEVNLEKLRREYPAQVEAVTGVSDSTYGIFRLMQIAGVA